MNEAIEIDKSERIFVTGASGFIGTALVRQLLADGYRVRGMSRKAPTLPPGFENRAAELWEHPNFEFASGDVTDPESLTRGMAGCPYVIHLAGYAKNFAFDPTTFLKINRGGMINVFQAAQKLGVKKVVWTSSVVALGVTAPGVTADESTPRISNEYLTEYEESKALAEIEARQWTDRGFPAVTVNPTRVYGPGPLSEGNSLGILIDDYMRGRFPILINYGKNIGNYGLVDDVARGHFLALLRGRPGECYLLGGENASLEQFFQTINRVTGERHFMLKIWKFFPMLVAHLMELRAKLTKTYPRITPGWIRTFTTDWRYSCDKAVRELGYEITPLEEGLRRTCDWILANRTDGTK